MSGKPQYDETSVIDAAMEVFWRHGYAAASISDLTAATGLSRSSIYQRFGDKDGLFQEVLAAYTERLLRRMNAARGETQRERLEALLRHYLPKPSAPTRMPGCLLARSCTEMADLSAPGQEIARAGIGRQHELLASLLRDAVTAGELPQETDIGAMAWHYLGVMQAILNLPQAGATPLALDRMVDIAMSVWPVADNAAPAAPVRQSKQRKPGVSPA
jgi:AcrR family transcriptional regulator